jgi:tRNA pseudouridine55 synthase
MQQRDVRSRLGEDIGAALGCGAHLKELRRIQVGHLVLEKSITLDFLESLPEEQRLALLDPVDALLSSFPAVHLNQELARRFLHGQRLALGKETVSCRRPLAESVCIGI